jgi:hypothetical protein
MGNFEMLKTESDRKDDVGSRRVIYIYIYMPLRKGIRQTIGTLGGVISAKKSSTVYVVH